MRGNSEELEFTRRMNELTSPVSFHRGEANRKKETERHRDRLAERKEE
jgi:hypothetical protein